MESKTMLKAIVGQMCDQNVEELPLIDIMRQLDNKSIDISSRSDCELYLDLLSEAFVLFGIKANHLSTCEQSVVVCDRLMSLTNKYETKRINESIDKSLDDLISNISSFEKKVNECLRETKSQESFESVMAEKIAFYSKKFKEYYHLVKTKENSLSVIGFTSGLRHEFIEELRRSNEQMSDRLNDMNARLNEYKDFNPTESELKNKINEIKQQINEYDNYFVKQ